MGYAVHIKNEKQGERKVSSAKRGERENGFTRIHTIS
jgi:hypothetical protein